METAVVKNASGYFSAECLPPKVTLPKIKEAARKAVLRLGRWNYTEAIHCIDTRESNGRIPPTRGS